MKSHALLKGGEAMLFSIPISWDTNGLQSRHDKESFKAGILAPGKYKIGLQIEVYMETEFKVEYSPIPLHVIVKTCSDICFTIGQKNCQMFVAKLHNFLHPHNRMRFYHAHSFLSFPDFAVDTFLPQRFLR